MTSTEFTETQSDVGLQLHWEIERFLISEAEVLDDNRQREWLDFIAPDIVYRIPVRVTLPRSEGTGFSSDAFHMDEDRGTLEMRVRRLETEYAFAEDPPSRTRRYVTNVRVVATENSDEYLVKSNLLVFRSRYDTPDYQLLAGERVDQIRRDGTGLKLSRRTVYLDQSTLGTHNLAIFL